MSPGLQALAFIGSFSETQALLWRGAAAWMIGDVLPFTGVRCTDLVHDGSVAVTGWRNGEAFPHAAGTLVLQLRLEDHGEDARLILSGQRAVVLDNSAQKNCFRAACRGADGLACSTAVEPALPQATQCHGFPPRSTGETT